MHLVRHRGGWRDEPGPHRRAQGGVRPQEGRQQVSEDRVLNRIYLI